MTSQELQLHYDEIKQMYLVDNISSAEIAKKFNVKRYQINYILEKNGIQKTVSQVRRKYDINEYFFDEIDTANKAYILGFLYADGYNNKNNNTITLTLSQKDEDILKLIQTEIGSTKPLYYFNSIHKDGVERHMVSMVLVSKHMCNTLEKLGVYPNKTFILQFPNFLPKELYSHFIRGYFDGDGCACIYSDKTHKNLRFSTSMVSSNSFCKGLQKHLQLININFYVGPVSGKSTKLSCLRSGSDKENEKFMKYIYKDADLYMKRKYHKFAQWFLKKD